MGQLVKPEVFLTGFTEIYEPGVQAYLEKTKQMDFWDDYVKAREAGISGGESLCSMYAKLCYKSLVVGKNANVQKVRSVKANLEGCFDTGHGSVFEHCNINFLVTDCSRVYTHEQVRQRAGWAYSQTSGRYCRLDQIDLVWSKLLDPVKDLWLKGLKNIEDLVYLSECRLGLRKPNPATPLAPDEAATWDATRLQREGYFDSFVAGVEVSKVVEALRWVPDDSFNFDKRKAITSAIRRIAPNGQANEIGMTANIRALRHVVQLRTAPFAETEIRDIFGQVFNLTRSKFPTLWYKSRTKIVDDLLWVYGMKSNPYDITPGDPSALEFWTTKDMQNEITRRELAA